MPLPPRTACRSGTISPAASPAACRCRKFRSSAAARTPRGASTYRISWSFAPRAKSFAEALDVTAQVYAAAGKLLAERGLLQGVADEGGYWPAFGSNEETLDMLVRAIERAGLTPGGEVAISLDIAASSFGGKGRYRLALEGRELDSDGSGRHCSAAGSNVIRS